MSSDECGPRIRQLSLVDVAEAASIDPENPRNAYPRRNYNGR